MRNQRRVPNQAHFLTRVGAATTVALLVLAPAAMAQQPEEGLQRSFTVSTGSTLRIVNYKGTIHISGSDRNQITVAAVKRFQGGTESERKWWMENTKVSFRSDSGRVEVTVDYASQSWSCWLCWSEHGDYIAQVELDIQVPRRTNLDLDGYKPDIKISSLQGDIRIQSYKAPMSIESTTGAIHINTYKDVIRLRNVAVRGGLNVHSYKAETEVDVKSLEGSATLDTSRGNIAVRVPGDMGLDVDFAGSRRSGFHTDLPMTTQAGERYGHNVRGTINGGGAHLVVRTERGSVSIEKRAGEL